MIDAEFACMGPIAFDVGKMVGNLLLAFFAADGLASAAEPRHAQRRWLLEARRPPRGCGALRRLRARCSRYRVLWWSTLGPAGTPPRRSPLPCR
jgi:hypothetical protein